MAYLKEQIAIAALTIRKETQIMGLSRELLQGLERLLKEFSIFLATIYLPNEPTGSIEQEYGPPRGRIWRDILLDLCIPTATLV